jgi:signal transduction histidine kinase
MKRLITLTAAAMLSFASSAYSQGKYGTEAEAKAMLDKATSAVKSNKMGALESMRKGEAGAVDRDLYVFCANASDGAFTVHPTLMGKNLRDVKDKNGKALGEEMLKVAKEGSYDAVTYYWPRPGADTTPVEKVSFVTKVSDQICGVGYYK